MPPNHQDALAGSPRQEACFNDSWFFRPYQSPFLELTRQAAPWEPVTLPHDAMISQPRSARAPERAGMAFFPDGAWEYRKVLDVPDDWRERRAVLEFEGVYRGAKVYINGSLAGERPYGYSGFLVDLNPYLRFGRTNEILVRAHTHEDSRWYSGAGIYRNTWLILTQLVHVAPHGVRVTTEEIVDDGALVAVAATVSNHSAVTVTTEALIELVDEAGAVVAAASAPVTVAAGESTVIRQRFVVTDPALWDLDHPHLYSCRTRLTRHGEALDDVSALFGIRTVSVDPVRGFRLNGRSVKLRGACVHHDNGILGAATISRSDERRVQTLKAAGFNAIRSAHNPMSVAMLDACDRHGMLVMDEAFDVWTSPKTADDYAREFPTWSQADVEAMVVKDFNHPSVVMYSIGNEIHEAGNPIATSWGRRLAEQIRAIDATRPVTCGVNALLAVGPSLFAGRERTTSPEDDGKGVNTQMTDMKDVLPQLMRSEVVGRRLAETFSYLDVAGYNYLESRYELDGELFPNRVIVGSETQPGDIARNWNLVQQLDHVIGDFTWTGWDYLGEVGVGRTGYAGEEDGTGQLLGFMGTYPWLTAWCGDIDITGHRRPVSYYREIVFGLRSEPYIAVQRPDRYAAEIVHAGVWGWSDSVSSWSWSGFEDKPVRVEVYADADDVELVVNGNSLGRQAAGPGVEFKTVFDTTYRSGELVAVAYRDGQESGRSVLRSADGPVLLHASADRSAIRADHHDLAYVSVTLVDAHGSLYTNADRAVTVEVTGPGRVQGLGSANPRTEEAFHAPQHTTFDGRLLAAVRPTGPGLITVIVTADDCEPARVEITAHDEAEDAAEPAVEPDVEDTA